MQLLLSREMSFRGDAQQHHQSDEIIKKTGHFVTLLL